MKALVVGLVSLASTTDFHVEARFDRDAVEFGEALEVRLHRAWPTSWRIEPWDETAFHPLVLELVDRSLDESTERSEEVLVFRARAFSLTDVALEPVTITALDPRTGESHTASTAPLSLTVRPAVDRDQPGEIEAPSGLLDVPSARSVLLPWTVGGVVTLAFAAALFALARRERARAAARGAREQRERRLRARITELERRLSAPTLEVHGFASAVAALVRDALAERFAIPARALCREELWRRGSWSQALSDSQRDTLDELLHDCDRLEFSILPASREDCTRTLETATRCLHALGFQVAVPEPRTGQFWARCPGAGS